jgi:hypothetical protein
VLGTRDELAAGVAGIGPRPVHPGPNESEEMFQARRAIWRQCFRSIVGSRATSRRLQRQVLTRKQRDLYRVSLPVGFVLDVPRGDRRPSCSRPRSSRRIAPSRRVRRRGGRGARSPGHQDPSDLDPDPVSPTRLQAAQVAFLDAIRLSGELDERGLDAFLSFAAIRVAHEASRLEWWRP